MALSTNDLVPLCRNIFTEQTYYVPNYAPTQAKHLRWGLFIWFIEFLSQIVWIWGVEYMYRSRLKYRKKSS